MTKTVSSPKLRPNAALGLQKKNEPVTLVTAVILARDTGISGPSVKSSDSNPMKCCVSLRIKRRSLTVEWQGWVGGRKNQEKKNGHQGAMSG